MTWQQRHIITEKNKGGELTMPNNNFLSIKKNKESEELTWLNELKSGESQEHFRLKNTSLLHIGKTSQ